MDWTEDDEDGAIVFTISGDVTISELIPLQQVLLQKQEANTPIVLDLEMIDACDMPALRFLLSLVEIARHKENSIKLRNMPDAVATAADKIGVTFREQKCW